MHLGTKERGYTEARRHRGAEIAAAEIATATATSATTTTTKIVSRAVLTTVRVGVGISKLREARSRMYRRRILQILVNTKYLFEYLF